MTHNKQLQRTVRDKVPRHVRQRAAAELRRYTATEAISSFELSLGVASRWRAVRNSVSPVREAVGAGLARLCVVAIGRSTRVLSRSGSADLALWHQRLVEVGASLSTLSLSARGSGEAGVGHAVRKRESSERVGGFTAVGATLRRCRLPYNKQLQRTVRDKVPRHIGQRAAAELRR